MAQTWLKSEYMKSETKGMLTTAQKQELPTEWRQNSTYNDDFDSGDKTKSF